MWLTLAHLRKLPDLVDEFRDAAQKRATGSADAAAEMKSLRDASTWEGQASDAANDALDRKVTALETSHETDKGLVSAATSAHDRATQTVKDLDALVDYAEESPACHIDEATNTVHPPDTSFLSDDARHAADAKLVDVQNRLHKILAEGQEADTEFGNAIRSGTGGAAAPDAEDGKEDGDALKNGQLTPEELARLKQATSLSPDQIKAWEAGELVLPKSQMEYLNSVARSMDGKNIQELRAMMDKLDKTNPTASQNLMNGFQMLSDPKVHAAGGDMKGGLDRLPDGIRNVAGPPPKFGINNPDHGNMHNEDRRDLAAIMMRGTSDYMHGSDLDRSVLKQTEQLLKGNPDWTFAPFDKAWELQTNYPLKDMLTAAGRDQWAVHDLVAGSDGRSPNNEYISNLLRHNWDDGGAAAGTLLHGLAPVASDTTQLDAATRAGQTVHAFDQYIGSHGAEFTSMTALEPKDRWPVDQIGYRTDETFGKAEPQLVQALAEANTPFLDDMVGHDLNGTHGFAPLDDGHDANMPHTRDLLSILSTDPTAANTVHDALNADHLGYQKQYVDSIASHGTPDVDALKADSRLQGLGTVASSMAEVHQNNSEHAQATEAHEHGQSAYDALETVGGSIPGVSNVLDTIGKIPGGDDLLQDMFGAGEKPDAPLVPNIAIQNSDANQYNIAQQLYAQGYGDQGAFPNGFPSYEKYADDDFTRNVVGQYLGQDVKGDLAQSNTSYAETLPHTPPNIGDK